MVADTEVMGNISDGNRFKGALQQYLAAESAGRDLTNEKRTLAAESANYIAKGGIVKVNNTVRTLQTKYPDSSAIMVLRKALYSDHLMRNLRRLPKNTYKDRLAYAASCQEALSKAETIAAKTGRQADKDAVVEAGRKWRQAETSAQKPTPGDMYRVVEDKRVPAGTIGTLMKLWKSEFGLRALLIGRDGQELWVDAGKIKRA